MFRIRPTATNYLQFIDFSKYRDDLMIAAHEGDMEYIAQVIAQETGDPWTAEDLPKFSLAGSKVFRFGKNEPEYFTFEKYSELITITIDTNHHIFGGYMNLQMSPTDGPAPTPLNDLIKQDDAEEESLSTDKVAK